MTAWIIYSILGWLVATIIIRQERQGPYWVQYINAQYKNEKRRQRWITKYRWKIFAVVAMRYHRIRAQQLTTMLTNYDPGTKATLYGQN